MIGKSIEELKVGDKASFTKTITETDVYLYAGVSGDLNPAHINQVEAEKSMFKGRIAHGMLTASLISTVLGCYLPGPGTIYLGQNLKFKKPVRFGDTITAVGEVISLDTDRNKAVLKTTCYNQNDEVVIEGEATCMPPKKA